jgi:predicted membrane protein
MIPRDKILHIGLGVLAIACALVALAVNSLFGLGACLAYTTTVTGVLYEVQQWYRKEGHPDLLDALATAAPGWVAWAFLEFL